MNIDNLPNPWLVMNGCMEAHESSFSINAHVGPPTICRIFGLQWMGAWKHISHRFQLRHMCDHRQFAKFLACDAWVRGSRSGKFPAARFGHREYWRHTSVMASARGTVWSREASCKRQRAAPFGHEASRAHFGHARLLAEEHGRHLLGTRL